MPDLSIFLLLTLAALLAGFVDAVVGGGGLIQLPALLLGLPAGTQLTTILGTNKVISFTGTTVASAQYVRARILPWRELVAPVVASMAGASLGVMAAYLLEGRFLPILRPTMVFLLLGMLLFTLLKPELGQLHAPRYGLDHQRMLAVGLAFALGFYDGLFGPGTGSLLIFLFVGVLGFDFLRASALSKACNWASNFASVTLFIYRGSWLPLVALSLAVANGLGGFLGARFALRHGSRWIRWIFVVVVGGLVLRLAWDAWRH